MSKNRTENPNISSERIDALEEHEIFVFGSNLAGYHGGGAARIANLKFGAEWGVGVGLTGQSYAIPTMHGGVETIKPFVDKFIRFAQANPELKFLVTRIGCGIAGFNDKEIAPLFIDAIHVDNIYLPTSFLNVIEDGFPQPYTRFMRMIAELHQRGHHLLRLCPSMSPNGLAWRATLTTRSNTLRVCGALLGSYEPEEGLMVNTNGYMPWFGRTPSATVKEDADIFEKTYPILAEKTLGEDKGYVEWFLRVLNECEHGNIIYAMAEYRCCISDGHLYGAHEPFCFPPMGEYGQP